MLHVVYRSYGGENQKGRPAYYSKVLALASLVRALSEIDGGVEVLYLNDGPIPADRLRLMESSGEVLARSQLGMRGSMQAALALPAQRAWHADDVVWFSEDDYLYQPSALSGLEAAAGAFPEADYFALYALIGNRLPNGQAPVGTPVPAEWQDSEPRLVRGQPWRRALSTTSTFGGRVGAIVEDRPLMHAAMWSGGAWDHTTCLLYQGFQPYPVSTVASSLRDASGPAELLKRTAVSAARLGLNGYQAARARLGVPGRLLIAPDPALVTHLESEFMALGTDWTAVARSTRTWYDARELVRSA